MKSVLRLAILSLTLGAGAHAEEVQSNPLTLEVDTGQIMICDTQKQVERFVTFSHITGSAGSAIKAVNTEAANPTACGIVDAAYLPGAAVDIKRTATEAFEIVPIIVVATGTPEGMRPTAPALFFTLVKINEVAV